jgi:hypothetical protein
MVNIIRKLIKITNQEIKRMKKLSLLAGVFISYCLSAQSFPPVYIQNYTPNYVEFTVYKANLGNPGGGCSPNLESRDATNNLLRLGFTNNPSVSTDANYDGNVNTTFAINPAVPTTPQIGRWILNSNFAAPFTAPAGPLTTFSMATTWAGIKFGVQDQSGVNTGGYYFMGQPCGSSTIVSDLTGSVIPSNMSGGSFFTAGGATWIVVY